VCAILYVHLVVKEFHKFSVACCEFIIQYVIGYDFT
jgi:hypothetical protein